MIEEIRIENLGVIAAATLELGEGLTVITGETGAGKTMVLTGLDLLLGGRVNPAMVRTGADRAVVEGTFRVPPTVVERVEDAGAVLDDGDVLLVSRTMPAEGRSRSFAGGRSVPQALLTEIADELVTVHGQSDQLRLRSPARQRELIDAVADHAPLLQRYRTVWQQLADARQRLEDWQARSDERAAEVARLRHGLTLLEELEPQQGEDDSLRAEAERLGNVEELRAAAGRAYAALGGAGGDVDATVLVAEARRSLDVGDPELVALGERLDEVTILLADVSSELGGYLTSLEPDPARLQHVHERRAALRDATLRLALTSPDALAEWSEQAVARITELDGPQDLGAMLATEVAELRTSLDELAGELRTGRLEAAGRLSEDVDAELAGLAMPGAHLAVRVEELDEPGPWGTERLTILLQPRPDAPPRPLGEGASGGELSRVMLALEVASGAARLAETAPTAGPAPTFVFDEVDAGVGGKAAIEVGRRLARLARGAQVVVVTHLAQVAAYADTHLLVAKATDGVTTTDVRRITGATREQELARMLSGQEDSDVARRHAAELLAQAVVAR